MSIVILNICISILISVVIGTFYLNQMTKRTEKWMDKFFTDYKNEYEEFLNELRKQRGLQTNGYEIYLINVDRFTVDEIGVDHVGED